jgi:hypothetical protein
MRISYSSNLSVEFGTSGTNSPVFASESKSSSNPTRTRVTSYLSKSHLLRILFQHGPYPKGWGVPDDQIESDGLYSPDLGAVPGSAATEVYTLLRAGLDEQGVYEAMHADRGDVVVGA